MEIYNCNNSNRKTLSTVPVVQMRSNGDDYHLSLPQASMILGVTRQRVLQLVEAGKLEAEYDVVFHYRRWRISKSSVHSRLDWMQSVGRKVAA